MENNLIDLAEKAVKQAMGLGCSYCDIRAENTKNQGIRIENNELEYSSTKNDLGLGIRILMEGAWGFFSISNPLSFGIIQDGLNDVIKSVLGFSSKKKHKSTLGNVKIVNKKIDYPVKNIPTLDKLIKIGYDCDKNILENKRIIKSQVSIGYSTVSKFFINSEGSKISQSFTDTVANLAATAYENGLTQTVTITEGGRGGIETLSSKNEITEISHFISKKASQLIDAKPAKNEKATVVMNPDFVALLTHEILGHPSEADRVLGKEMAWAGGAWWAGKLNEKIGSENLNVFDDPTIDGTLGCYQYDDEGNKAKRTNLVENGVLSNHLQSRETAEIFQTNPSANMRASSYRYMPLIRMACTCIEKGDWKPEEMISEVKNGYLISNMKIPSIDMKRYNWSISCQFANKIENGEIKDLLRDVIVLGTAPDFFKSIDACGTDFTVRPITNCGKGDPMQSMIMGNGGPSIRANAIVRSV
ncbi:MAG: TldD/PmbA family protein [Nitrosopumilaceae archaeon]